MPAATSIEADLVTYNKRAPVAYCNQLYGYGLRCGVSIADHVASTLVLGEQVSNPFPILKASWEVCL